MTASLRIQRLHARIGPGAQPVAARLALQSLGAELADALPSALAPQALLMLRRLHLALPANALRQWPDAALRQQLREAGRRQLRDVAAQARRPALEWVGDDAPAVLFADEAELLACLARDALRDGGVRLARWWWRDLLQGAWPDWRTAFAQRPQAVPAALRLLERVDAGLAILLRLALEGADAPSAPARPGLNLTPHGAPYAAVAVARKPRQRRGLAELNPISSDPPGGAETALPGTALGHARAKPDQVPPVTTPPQPPPVAKRTPALPPAAPVQSARAVRGGVDAARTVSAAARPPASAAPTARSARFAPVAARPVDAAARPRHALPDVATEPLAQRQRASPTAAQVTMPPQPAATSATSATSATAPGRAPPTTPAEQPELPASSGTPLATPRLAPSRSSRAPPNAMPPEQSAAPPAPTPDAAPDWPLPQALRSPQARLLLLVGALQDDGLYPDFTRPRDAGFPLPVWQLLAALGAQWLGAAALRRDPFWQALLSRSGKIPRLKSAQLADWWPLAGAAPGRPSLAAWLRGYGVALRQRLLARLDLDDADFNASLTAQPGERPAWVWLSEADIVAVFDLNHHPLAWRLAGLDRDPGFLPSAGLSLRYRFE